MHKTQNTKSVYILDTNQKVHRIWGINEKWGIFFFLIRENFGGEWSKFVSRLHAVELKIDTAADPE